MKDFIYSDFETWWTGIRDQLAQDGGSMDRFEEFKPFAINVWDAAEKLYTPLPGNEFENILRQITDPSECR